MNRTRYLPPGSMRRQRRLGRLEGSIGTLLLVAVIGAALVAATPPELYTPAPATVRPAPTGAPGHLSDVAIPPCTGAGKDCSAADPHNAAINTVPEPGTLALIGAGLAGLIWRTKA